MGCVTLTPHRPPVSPTAATHPAHRLLDRLAAGTPLGIVFGGQGEAAWLEHLADLLRRHDVELAPLMTAVDERLAPVADELRRSGTSFEPLVWADRIAAGESAVDEDWPAPSVETYLTLSLSYYRLGDFAAAIRAAELAIAIKPDSAEAYNNLGAAHAERGEWAAAVQALETAVRLKPDLALARNNLAWARSGAAKR